MPTMSLTRPPMFAGPMERNFIERSAEPETCELMARVNTSAEWASFGR